MVFAYNETLRSIKVSNPELAKRIRKYLKQKFEEARGLNATWQPIGSHTQLAFTLYGLCDTVQVTIEHRAPTRLVFANRERAAYNLDIFPDNSMMVYSASPGTVAPVASYFNTLCQLAVGPAERTAYGWTTGRRLTSVILPGKTTYRKGINHPPELECYVLQNTFLPRLLRLPPKATNASLGQWCMRFWTTQGDELRRIGDRISQLPSEVWLIRHQGLKYLQFTSVDGKLPALVSDKLYVFQDLRENSPKQQPLNQKPYQIDIRGSVRP